MKRNQFAAHAVPAILRVTTLKLANRGLRTPRQPRKLNLPPAARHKLRNRRFPIHAPFYRHGNDSGNSYSNRNPLLIVQSAYMHAIDAATPAGRLKAARKAAGLSQVAVAALAGLSQAAVSEAENTHPPNMLAVNMAALSGALGITLDFVMHGQHAEKTALEAEVLALLRQAPPDMRDAALRTLRALLTNDGKRRAA
jgi:transcriptional regulator with XRE-family HTH domain